MIMIIIVTKDPTTVVFNFFKQQPKILHKLTVIAQNSLTMTIKIVFICNMILSAFEFSFSHGPFRI